MIFRCILPDWAVSEFPNLPKVREGRFTNEQLKELNNQNYNIYYLPNYPSSASSTISTSGTDIDTFSFVFVDCDLKDKKYASKEDFISKLHTFQLAPSFIVDSGHGAHAYWQINDLDAMSYLRLQRRLIRWFNTDESVCKIYQLMRLPDTINTKNKENPILCKIVFDTDAKYSCEDLDKVLAPISMEDEAYCVRHFNQTYKIEERTVAFKDELPFRFKRLLKDNDEVKTLYTGDVRDRSKADYRLGHILFAEGFNKEDALSVLANSRKAINRAPVHRYNYAMNIIEKIWTFEEATPQTQLSHSVKDILRRGTAVTGTRFPCWNVFDATHAGFRLSHVMGLIGGAGSGKTTLALNYFYWFTKLNPDYTHVFVSLEQPEEEIAQRWVKLCGDNTNMHDRVHVLGNYNPDGSYRNLSLSEIEDYILNLERESKTKVGCVVIDHIGVLKKQGKEGEFQGIIDICHNMKAFARRVNCFLIMQSQTSREKAGIGDLELDKDAAYGTSMFEWYCDYVVTTWQPLKRIYSQASHMTCTAFKNCKIRHKNVKLDRAKEDNVYVLMFDTETELLRELTQTENEAYDHYNKIATTLRNKDRKREPTQRTLIDWAGKQEVKTEEDTNNGKISLITNGGRNKNTNGVS